MLARGRWLSFVVCTAIVSLCMSAQASAAPPEASVQSPEGIATGEATLSGQVNPGGQPTTYHFEYGTSVSYGASVPAVPASAGSGAADVTVSERIVGLLPGTTYHYRLVASNATETVSSQDATFSTYSPPASSGECPNEERRAEQGATRLPDCRAYEMVSPLDKNGSNALVTSRAPLDVSFDGDRASYATTAGFGDTRGSGGVGFYQYLATRKEGVGWQSHGITPAPAPDSFQFISGDTIAQEFSSDLSKTLWLGYDLPEAEEGIPKASNYYVEDNETDALETVTKPLTAGPFNLFSVELSVRGVSEDLGVVTLETAANLLPEAVGGARKLYAWEHGVLKLAGVLPDGTLPEGGSQAARKGGGTAILENRGTVSRDGSRIVFVATPDGTSEPQLYMRKNGSASVWVSEPELAGASAEPQEVKFQAMTPDGHEVLFTTAERLLAADPGGSGMGLYMYTDGPDPASESNLTFITRIGSEGSVTGISEDARRIYFFSGEAPGFPQRGTYLWDEGNIHLVAPTYYALPVLGRGEDTQVSADGRQIAFLSNESFDGASLGEEQGRPLQAMYLYDEDTNSLTCVSCLPTGQPTKSAALTTAETAFVEAGVSTGIRTRFLSSNGRYVFFSTSDALVPADVNGVEDVYEYDVPTKTVSLLSTGTGDSGMALAGSDGEGNNVFIGGAQSLLAEDTDTLVDLYDVRVDGGFPQPPVQTGGCVGDECQGTPSAVPSFSTASGFTGLGNIAAKPGAPAPRRARPLTRAGHLQQALKACRAKRKSARKRCTADARRKYGPRKSVKKASRRVGR